MPRGCPALCPEGNRPRFVRVWFFFTYVSSWSAGSGESSSCTPVGAGACTEQALGGAARDPGSSGSGRHRCGCCWRSRDTAPAPQPQLRLETSPARQGGGVLFIQKQASLLAEDSGCVKFRDLYWHGLGGGRCWVSAVLPGAGCCCLSAACAAALP